MGIPFNFRHCDSFPLFLERIEELEQKISSVESSSVIEFIQNNRDRFSEGVSDPRLKASLDRLAGRISSLSQADNKFSAVAEVFFGVIPPVALHFSVILRVAFRNWLANPATAASGVTSLPHELPDGLRYKARELATALHSTPKEERGRIETLLFRIPGLQQKIYEGHVDNFLDKLSTEESKDTIREDILVHRRLSVPSTGLTTLPSETWELKNLTDFFDLHGCTQLASLPPQIEQLVSLRTLVLGGCDLTTLSSEIGQLANLEVLNLVGNSLTSLPQEIGKLTNLRLLDLTRCRQLTNLPMELSRLSPNRGGRLTLLLLEGNPLVPQAENERMLGRAELREVFGDYVVLDDPLSQTAMPITTTEREVYDALDAKAVRIHRENFRAATLPEIPVAAIEDGETFMVEYHRLYSWLNFDQAGQPGYLGPELVLPNDIPRLTGYLKTLYDLPLGVGEQAGWQMYDAQKPAMKKALTYILSRLNAPEIDPDQRASLFLQFLDGMLHCPTGQKEGIDTVVKALLEAEGTTERSSDLIARVRDLIASKKNAFFKTAVLSRAAENTQNVHLISHYGDELIDILGLTNVLTGYTERMGTFGQDPFSGNKHNVLKTFYDLVTPQRLVDWMIEKTPTSDELGLRDRLAELEERVLTTAVASAANPFAASLESLRKQLREAQGDERPSLEARKRLRVQIKESQDEVEQDDECLRLEARIGQLEMLSRPQTSSAQPLSADEREKMFELRSKIRQVGHFKGLTPQLVIEYLINKNLVDTGQATWWEPYFSANPSVDTTASITRDGALQLLKHLGYVTAG